MNQILLNGINLNQLLESIGSLIETKLKQIRNHPIQENDKYISRKEVAKLLKISLPTLSEWTKHGWLVAYKIGSRVLYKMQEVELSISKVQAFKHKSVINKL